MMSVRDSKFFRDSFVEDSEFEQLHSGFELNGGDDTSVDTTGDRMKDVAAKETRKVRIWRYLVILMLLVAGASTSVLTYFLLHGEEEEDFETSVSAGLFSTFAILLGATHT